MLFRVPGLLVNIGHIQKINDWQTWPGHVCSGSNSEVGGRNREVRFIPESRLNSDIAACPFGAMYGRRPRCKKRPARAQGLASLPSNGQATFRRFGRCKSGSVWSRAVKTDLDFLLYPLPTEGPPECPACGTPMVIVLHEARENNPDFSRFRCAVCKRSETFICGNSPGIAGGV